MLSRDLDLITPWRPDLVILDEAQRIKNWKTRAARSVKQIESPHAIVLTGTPLENRLGRAALDRRVRRPLPASGRCSASSTAPARHEAAGWSATAS